MQPAGPYHLLGACFGGLVALELAQRLRAEGEEVGLSAWPIRHCPTSGLPAGNSGANRHPVRFRPREAFRARPDQPPPRRTLKFLRGKAHHVASMIRSRSLPHDTKEEIAKRRVIDANHAAAQRYVPQPYGGAALYVRSRDRPSGRGVSSGGRHTFPPVSPCIRSPVAIQAICSAGMPASWPGYCLLG